MLSIWTSLKCYINTVSQFFNNSASGLSKEKKRKFIYFVDARRMPLFYTGRDVIVKYMFDPTLIKLTLIDSVNLWRYIPLTGESEISVSMLIRK